MIMGKTGNGTEFDVIVIGGGATGAGTARDCAMRGLRVLLLERFDYTNGATGRNHGLLHSGARYAVNDGESAAECIRENRILRRIASHCVEENGGLFISLPEDDLSYQDKFVESCRKAGIEAEAIDPKEAIRLEPSVNPSLTGAVKVPDGSIDPFRRRIVAQDGTVKNDGTRCFLPEDLLHMDWLCDNVLGEIPRFEDILPMSRSMVRELGIYREQIPAE